MVFSGFMATQTPRYFFLFDSLLGFIVIIIFLGVWVVEFSKEFAQETDILSLDPSDGLLHIRISAYERSSLMVASGYTFADWVFVSPGSAGPLWNEMILQFCSMGVDMLLIRFGHDDLAKHPGDSFLDNQVFKTWLPVKSTIDLKRVQILRAIRICCQ